MGKISVREAVEIIRNDLNQINSNSYQEIINWRQDEVDEFRLYVAAVFNAFCILIDDLSNVEENHFNELKLIEKILENSRYTLTQLSDNSQNINQTIDVIKLLNILDSLFENIRKNIVGMISSNKEGLNILMVFFREFKRVVSDPELEKRYILISEKKKIFDITLDNWQEYLHIKIEKMPWMKFESIFEFVFYTITNTIDSNSEIMMLNDNTFANHLRLKAELIVEDQNNLYEKFKDEQLGKSIHVTEGKDVVLSAKYSNSTKPDTTGSSDEEQLTIQISILMQTKLFNTLSRYVAESDCENLKKLLSRVIIYNRVWVKMKLESLAYIFKQAIEAEGEMIITNKITLSKWLSIHFSYGTKTPRDVVSVSTYNVLRGNKKVTKEHQIRLR